MALAANDLVLVTVPSIVAVPQSSLPITGRIESTGPSVVCWQNGKRTTYTDSTTQLAKVLTSTTGAPLISQRVQIQNYPNPGQRDEGIVVAAFQLVADSGATIGDFLIIRTPLGMFVTIPVSGVTVVPNS